MAIARSKITAQGQISVPVEIRRKLGIGAGSVLEWEEKGDDVVVRRAGQFSSVDIHQSLFRKKRPKPHTLDELKAGVGESVRARFPRGNARGNTRGHARD